MSADEQQNLWEWAKEKFAPAARLRDTRGALVLSELPDDHPVCPDSARELQRRLEHDLGVVDLILTDNRRRMVTARRRRDRQVLRLHHMFVDYDEPTAAALVRLARGHEDGRPAIKDFIARNREAIRRRPDPDNLKTAGDVHDLSEVIESARRQLGDLDEDLDDVLITWGRNGRGRRSIRFGSFDFERRLVRIHPALDVDWVPRYFVEFVVYHELLHAVFPPRESSGKRRELHTDEFRAHESEFDRYDDAVAWEKENIRRLLDR